MTIEGLRAIQPFVQYERALFHPGNASLQHVLLLASQARSLTNFRLIKFGPHYNAPAMAIVHEGVTVSISSLHSLHSCSHFTFQYFKSVAQSLAKAIPLLEFDIKVQSAEWAMLSTYPLAEARGVVVSGEANCHYAFEHRNEHS